jgi:hypothetical protein
MTPEGAVALILSAHCTADRDRALVAVSAIQDALDRELIEIRPGRGAQNYDEWRPLRPKRDGECCVCRAAVEAGEASILWAPRRGLRHGRCAP